MQFKSQQRFGFTLLEVMIALGVGVLVMVFVSKFGIDSSRLMGLVQSKGFVNRDARKFMEQMATRAAGADYAVLYSNFSATTPSSILRQDQVGNCVVFVTVGPVATPASGVAAPIVGLVGYYTTQNAGSAYSTLYCFSVDVPASQQMQPLSTLVFNSTNKTASFPCVTNVRGLFNGKFFYNAQSRSLLAALEVSQGSGKTAVTNTYEFTITTKK